MNTDASKEEKNTFPPEIPAEKEINDTGSTAGPPPIPEENVPEEKSQDEIAPADEAAAEKSDEPAVVDHPAEGPRTVPEEKEANEGTVGEQVNEDAETKEMKTEEAETDKADAEKGAAEEKKAGAQNRNYRAYAKKFNDNVAKPVMNSVKKDEAFDVLREKGLFAAVGNLVLRFVRVISTIIDMFRSPASRKDLYGPGTEEKPERPASEKDKAKTDKDKKTKDGQEEKGKDKEGPQKEQDKKDEQQKKDPEKKMTAEEADRLGASQFQKAVSSEIVHALSAEMNGLIITVGGNNKKAAVIVPGGTNEKVYTFSMDDVLAHDAGKLAAAFYNINREEFDKDPEIFKMKASLSALAVTSVIAAQIESTDAPGYGTASVPFMGKDGNNAVLSIKATKEAFVLSVNNREYGPLDFNKMTTDRISDMLKFTKEQMENPGLETQKVGPFRLRETSKGINITFHKNSLGTYTFDDTSDIKPLTEALKKTCANEFANKQGGFFACSPETVAFVLGAYANPAMTYEKNENGIVDPFNSRIQTEGYRHFEINREPNGDVMVYDINPVLYPVSETAPVSSLSYSLDDPGFFECFNDRGLTIEEMNMIKQMIESNDKDKITFCDPDNCYIYEVSKSETEGEVIVTTEKGELEIDMFPVTRLARNGSPELEWVDQVIKESIKETNPSDYHIGHNMLAKDRIDVIDGPELATHEELAAIKMGTAIHSLESGQSMERDAEMDEFEKDELEYAEPADPAEEAVSL